MIETIDLSQEHEYAVKLLHPEFGGLAGVLRFGANKWPQVVLNDFSSTRHIAKGTALPIVKASGEITFTLFDCIVAESSIYADYLVLGDVQPSDLKIITIRYSEVPEWLANYQHIEGKLGDKLTWSNNPKPIEVKLPSEQMTINSVYIAHMVRNGEDYVLHQHIEFVVEKISGVFTLEDVQRITVEIASLFSILLACPVSLLSVSVGSMRRHLKQVYFPGIEKAKKSFSKSGYMVQCFIQAKDIEDRWQAIFENYYKSAIRNLIWVRLSGMKRYDGFWEFRVLGYVGLLDQYVKRATKDRKKLTALSKRRLAAVGEAINSVEPAITDEQREKLVGAISSKLGTNELSFAERLAETLNATDADIVKIVGLSNETFRTIKDVRDAASHGDELKSIGKDVTHIETITAKIELLLTYWAFIDFGLTKDDFLKCLTLTRSDMRVLSRLDEVRLDRVMDGAAFFNVADDKLREIAEVKNIQHLSFFVVDVNGGIHYSDHFRTLYREWEKRRASCNESGATSVEDIFNVPKTAVSYRNWVYIESGAERLKLYSVYLFQATKLPTA